MTESKVTTTGRYRLLFDTTPCYITVQGRDLKIQEYNKRFEEDFGRPNGAPCYEAYKQRTEPCETCPVAEAFADGREHHSEEVVRTKDGRLCWVLVRAAPIFDDDGNVEAVMEVSTNVTELKELQTRMSAVGELVSSLAHTVKGIVMSLEGGCYVVNTGFECDRDEMVKKGWDIVERNIGRVTTLCLDMLHYAKDREPEWTTVDLAGLVREVTALFESKFHRHGIETRLQMPPEEPIVADERALHSLMISLLENAVDACRWDVDNEDHVVWIRLRSEDDQAVLVIEDDGVGMDEETQARLFTPLFSTKRGGGTGLGLLVAKKVVEEHGGTLEVASAPDRGARFTVRLPREQPGRDVEESAT